MSKLNIESTIIVGEIGQAHEGSLDTAYAYIDAVAAAGLDGVKFQVHLANEETTRDDQFRVNKTKRNEDRYDYWKRMEFSASEWTQLGVYARSKDLLFICSVFSEGALELLGSAPVDAVKIASGDVDNLMLLEKVTKTGKPIILSSGMSKWSELDTAVDFLKDRCPQLIVMQCTSQYPTPLNQTGLNVIDQINRRYNVPVGFSDHSGSIFPGLLALSMNVAMLEVHVVFDRRCFGYDVSSSLIIDELEMLNEYKKAIVEMTSAPVDKDRVADELSDIRALFARSIGVKDDLKQGTILSKELMVPKKPGTGIPYQRVKDLIGKTLTTDINNDQLLTWEHVGG